MKKERYIKVPGSTDIRIEKKVNEISEQVSKIEAKLDELIEIVKSKQ
ncbi:MAG: hypothetical protein IJR53_07105 [Bacteroidales bacterium]|nr:hypothetical protein [Bacteroidales bacterium]